MSRPPYWGQLGSFHQFAIINTEGPHPSDTVSSFREKAWPDSDIGGSYDVHATNFTYITKFISKVVISVKE